MPWAATGVSPRLANGGCDANLTDIVIQGTIAYVTAEAPSPGCWEGYYAANIADGSLIYNERCLGGSAALAIANGWLYRGSHNHDCAKNVGGYVGPNNANNFVWYRLESARLSDGRLGHWTPKMNGGSTGTTTTVGPQVLATDGTQIFVGGDQSQLNGVNQQGLARFSPTGGNSRLRCRPRHESPRPRPAPSRSVRRGSRTTTTACSTTRSTEMAAPTRSRPRPRSRGPGRSRSCASRTPASSRARATATS